MSKEPEADAARISIWTIGHSTRPLDEFIKILKAHEIGRLVDVRSFPRSRRFPHFNSESLAEELSTIGVGYTHLPELGGRRKPIPNSRNIALKNASFRAYADYMETLEFTSGIESLTKLAMSNRTAVMCAEVLWWRCHRSLIADYLKSKGLSVKHIINANREEPHSYTSAAGIVEGRLSYTGLFSDL